VGEKIHSPVRRQTHLFNRLGLPASAQAHANPDPAQPTAINEVAWEYDGFGSLLRHIQEHEGTAVLSGPSASKAVTYTREGVTDNQNRIATITYPSGQQYRLDYGAADSLDQRIGRVVAVKEITTSGEQTLVTYDFLGLTFVIRKTCPQPQITLDLWGGVAGVYAGLDLFSRVTDQRWTGVSGDAARLQYDYDRASRRAYRLDAVAQSLSKNLDELYVYDGLSQITSLRRGLLDAAHTDLEPDTENFNEAWQYDGIGNWDHYTQGNPAPALEQERTHNSVNEIVRFQGSDWPQPRHDATGNTTRLPGADDPSRPFRIDYDAWNRVSRIATFNPAWKRLRVTTSLYDARGWRVQTARFEEDTAGRSLLVETLDAYFDENWRALEDWATQSPTPPSGNEGAWTYYTPKFRQRFLWDQARAMYPDSLILRDRDTDNDEQPDERLYALQDAHFNTVALADDSGLILERVAYSAFGTAALFDADFEPISSTAYSWNIMFSAYPKEDWIGLYYVRNRYYHSRLGRWISRDPIHEKGGLNLFGFVSNNSINSDDLMGMTPVHIATTISGIIGLIAAGVSAYLQNKMAECEKKICKTGCYQCCNTLHLGASIALAVEAVAARIGCFTLTAPPWIGACLGAMAFAITQQKINIDMSLHDCNAKCPGKKPDNEYPCCGNPSQ